MDLFKESPMLQTPHTALCHTLLLFKTHLVLAYYFLHCDEEACCSLILV